MDYLDAMIEAERKEEALWFVKIDPVEDVFEIWRGNCLIEKKPGHKSFQTYRDKLAAMQKRFAMEAAYDAAREYMEEHGFLAELVENWAQIFENGSASLRRGNPTNNDLSNLGRASLAKAPPGTVWGSLLRKEEKPKIDWLALNKEMSG